MNDSIKRQIIEKIYKLPSVGLYPHVSLESVIKIINDTSFIDRCKNCEWWNFEYHQCRRQICAVFFENDYCSYYAERKNDETN